MLAQGETEVDGADTSSYALRREQGDPGDGVVRHTSSAA